jgi:hypothetical protein
VVVGRRRKRKIMLLTKDETPVVMTLSAKETFSGIHNIISEGNF